VSTALSIAFNHGWGNQPAQWWTLADAEDNDVDVATWMGRD